jgi:hypothetical protein
MLKYILGSLIVMYIFHTYLAPISRAVQQNRMNQQNRNGQSNAQPKKPKSGEYIDYEEVKD